MVSGKGRLLFVGMDDSLTALHQAAQRLDMEIPDWRTRGRLVHGTFQDLPFEDGVFDAVINNEAVYCNSFSESCQIYPDVARILKVNGLLYVRTFASGSWGDGSEISPDRHAWYCDDGPLKGKGLSRFTEKNDIPVLMKSFDILSTELLSMTENNIENTVKEWIITARKGE